MNIIIATLKSWNIEYASLLQKKYNNVHQIKIIQSKEELKDEILDFFKPDYIFFPHWSYIIPKEIYEKYNCVVFHMADLPFGRGGSPLQNLIVRGFGQTKISAIKVVEELDAGPIYMKEDLSLDGSAEEIFRRASEIIFNKMIPQFLEKKLTPYPQEGEPVIFKRRKPSDSELQPFMDEKMIYDYIRMLDAEGYPSAFLEFGDLKLEFTEASYSGKEVTAKVLFRRKKSE